MKIGVTGYRGNLGSELIKAGCFPIDCDVTSQESIKTALSGVRPDVLINCAAKTFVDGCELEDGYNEAIKVNFRGAVNLRDCFEGLFIHISTDYVFSCNYGPYKEDDDDPNPVNGYGFSKFGAEAGLMHIYPQNTKIVRTTGLYSGKPKDFAGHLISDLSSGKKIKVTDELRGNQTYIPHLVEALMRLAEFRNKDESRDIIHLASKEVFSRYEFAILLADVFGFDQKLIEPCSNADVGWIAKRPTNGGLVVDKAVSMGFPIYRVIDGLKALKKTL